MKKIIISIFSLLLIGQFSMAQSTVVMFLDIAGINGEYTTPTRTTVTSAPSKTQNLLITSYSFGWTSNTRMLSSNVNVISSGKTNDFGEMEINFQIDQSVIGLFDRLLNNTKTATIDLFIDKPANNIPTNQTEIKRIRIEQVTISSLSMNNPEIPQYQMKLKFEKVSIIEHNISVLGAVTKGDAYGYNFISKIGTGFYTF